MPKPLISVITINYNNAELTRDFLLSFRNVTYDPIEVIVVDNGSQNDHIDAVIKDFPEAIFIKSEENLGFAGGNNLGIDKAKGEYFLFINNDTEVEPGFIQPLVEALEQNPKMGIACPKILYFDTNILQYVGSGAINPYTGRSFRQGFKEEDKGQHDTSIKTELAHGAAMMIPRKVINEVGKMPEIFFLYYEEIDWCESIKRAGYEIWYISNSKVFHKESMSIGPASPFKTYYMTRNRLIFLRRNTKGLAKLSWIAFYSFFSIPKNSVKYLLKGEKEHLKAFWKGVTWNLTHANVKKINTIQK